ISLPDFISCVLLQAIQQIIGLNAMAFSPGDLDVRPLPVFGRKFDSEFLRASRTQCDDLVVKVDGMANLIVVSQTQQSLTNDVLKIRLTDVNDVVHPLPTAKVRMGFFTARRVGNPDRAVSGIVKVTVVKILIQQAELP